MAKIGFMVLCDGVYEDSNKNMNLVRPFSNIVLDNIPNNFSFTAALSFFEMKPNIEYTLEVEMLDPDSHTFWDFTGDIRFNAQNQDMHQTEMSIPFQNIKFQKTGVYKLRTKMHSKHDNTTSKDLLFVVSVRKGDSQ